MQNIPNPEAEPENRPKTKEAFCVKPGEGKKLLCYDYKALEMRLLACAAMEQDMIDIHLRGWDIHMGNASMVFNVPYEDVAKAKKKSGIKGAHLTPYEVECLEYRRRIKNIAFG